MNVMNEKHAKLSFMKQLQRFHTLKYENIGYIHIYTYIKYCI